MLKGIDVSKWQDVTKDKTVYDYGFNKGHKDFVIAKATEGRTYQDPLFEAHIAANSDKLLGAYHYARPDNGNSPEDEAENFVGVLKKHNLVGRALLALDWEQNSLKYPTEWALRWLRTVKELTGVKPLVYMSEAYISKEWECVAKEDYGLWVANWSKEPINISPWKLKALWQRQGSPLDLDVFYGDREAWSKYAQSEKYIYDSSELDEVELLRHLDDIKVLCGNIIAICDKMEAEKG